MCTGELDPVVLRMSDLLLGHRGGHNDHLRPPLLQALHCGRHRDARALSSLQSATARASQSGCCPLSSRQSTLRTRFRPAARSLVRESLWYFTVVLLHLIGSLTIIDYVPVKIS